ncbi:hypothetical protein JB92DRAFT_2930277 [Gautieria morchelliformis]|nr:hypothetical protein JB92DRAFT_2930277 [Gautieria morchelliformis]
MHRLIYPRFYETQAWTIRQALTCSRFSFFPNPSFLASPIGCPSNCSVTASSFKASPMTSKIISAGIRHG